MFDWAAHAIGVIEAMQSRLTACAGFAEVDRIILVSFDLERTSLHRADNQSTASRAFAASGCIIRAEAVVGVLRHFGIRFARNIARGRPAAGQYGGGCCADAG